MSHAEHSGYRTQLLHFNINSGETLSDEIHVGASRFITLYVPTVNSCTMYLRSAPTHTGSFYRLQNAAGAADDTWDIGTGLKVLAFAERFTALDHIKFETGVAQTDTRSFQAILGW